MDAIRPERKLLKLLAAGTVGLVLGLAITVGRIISIAPTPQDELAAALDNNAVFQFAIRHDASLREIYLGRLKNAYAFGGVAASSSEAHAIGQEIGRTFASTLLAAASDAALADFLDVTTQYLSEAYELDPDGCYAFARGRAEVGQSMLPAEVSGKLANAMLNIVATATSRPVKMSAEEWAAGRARVEEIRASIAQGEEAAMMYFGDYTGQPATTAAERKGTCLFLTRVYQDIVRTQVPLRYQTLRALSAPKPAGQKQQGSSKNSV